MGRPVTHTPASASATTREGQILVRHGLLRPRRTLVSASMTSPRVARHLGNGASAATRVSLEPLQDALKTFNVAAYARNGHIDGAPLDTALDEAAGAIARVRSAHRWPMNLLGRTGN